MTDKITLGKHSLIISINFFPHYFLLIEFSCCCWPNEWLITFRNELTLKLTSYYDFVLINGNKIQFSNSLTLISPLISIFYYLIDSIKKRKKTKKKTRKTFFSLFFYIQTRTLVQGFLAENEQPLRHFMND